MKFQVCASIILAVAFMALPMVSAGVTYTTDPDADSKEEEKGVVIRDVEITFDLNPDGTEMSPKKKKEAIDAYIKRFNKDSTDIKIEDIVLDEDDSDNQGGRQLQYNRKGGQSYFSAPKSNLNKKKGCFTCPKRRHLGKAIPGTQFDITKDSAPAPGSDSAIIEKVSNAQVDFDSAKDKCEIAKGRLEKIKEEMDDIKSKIMDARAKLKAVADSDPKTDKDAAVAADTQAIREMVKMLSALKDDRKKAGKEVGENCKVLLTKARKALAKAKAAASGVKIDPKAKDALKRAIADADKANHKMHMQ